MHDTIHVHNACCIYSSRSHGYRLYKNEFKLLRRGLQIKREGTHGGCVVNHRAGFVIQMLILKLDAAINRAKFTYKRCQGYKLTV